MPTSSGLFPAISGGSVASTPMPDEPFASIWQRWTMLPSVRPREVKPKFVSPSDPAAQWTGAHKGHAFFAYATNYLIDTENAVILDVGASRANRQAEVGASRTMIDRTARRFGIMPPAPCC
jgi:hypothetical protein